MGPADPQHLAWMGLALEEARRALATEDVPIGAVVIGPDGAVLASGRNEREALGDPTAHAEVVSALSSRAAGVTAGGSRTAPWW
jgi:tRNA(adenine34) deaminase